MGWDSPDSLQLTPPTSGVMSSNGRHDEFDSPEEIAPQPLPAAVTNPKADLLRFVYSKRVGHYRLGQVLGEGSFAKVKEGRDVVTGEKVSALIALFRAMRLLHAGRLHTT